MENVRLSRNIYLSNACAMLCTMIEMLIPDYEVKHIASTVIQFRKRDEGKSQLMDPYEAHHRVLIELICSRHNKVFGRTPSYTEEMMLHRKTLGQLKDYCVAKKIIETQYSTS